VPAWNQKLEKYVKDGKLLVLGIAQEQHPHRNRLFTQWHQINWPVLHDPINLMQVGGVPIEVAIDEHGIVRSTRIKADTLEQDFINKTFSSEGIKASKPVKPVRPDVPTLRSHAKQTNSADAWRELGDALVLWEDMANIDDAIEAYTQATRIKPNDGNAYFRLGVCYRMRYESDQQKPADFQMAVDHWTKARQINPNQYIWRRRIEQYGPRQTKPYPFYDWVETADREIKARGEKPIALKTLPTGSELAQPDRSFSASDSDITSPDPQGRVFRDTKNMILTEVTVVPPHARVGETMRVHVSLRPNSLHKAHWNNEAEPLRLWIDPVKGLEVQSRLLTAPQGDQPETIEPRRLEFEVRVTAKTSGTFKLNTYALYYVCEDVGGTCTYLRQDIPVTIKVGEE
jgi:tetratricopeptide (TPR) repeat protein